MTLGEAIGHAEQIADSYKDTEPNCKCAEEHRQFAEWLRELKAVTDRKDLISRAELFDKLAVIPAYLEENGYKAKVYAVIQGMDSVSEEENKDEDRERR